ncbi:MAG: Membrane-bound lysozyme-inhibitor of c-type lysozyme [Candidatus Accumulibacter adjunctus]|uniref:Membrane-bound lysozyme-inhibitor of c-type lysozyme n=1 Tax=Candidatus Accumulibacter adjunctus TaxID=1454001 RepID=A0A011PGG1_9PROT|nr:MAG: Membrane-bound lysozyme-inhibitor of c-type lysozyme [Candidatus Accumulibacter adjunctus]
MAGRVGGTNGPAPQAVPGKPVAAAIRASDLVSQRRDVVSFFATEWRTMPMLWFVRSSLPLLALLLGGCATSGTQSSPESSDRKESRPRSDRKQLDFRLASGTYRCDLGQSVEVERHGRDDRAIALRWEGKRHTLQRQASSSGLPRYEDRQNGLLWIDLPWKSVLMDVHSGRPLANECKPAANRTASG